MSTPRSAQRSGPERKNEKVLINLTQPTALFILDFDYKNQKNYVDFVFYDLNTLKKIKGIKELEADNLQVFDNGKRIVASDSNGIYVDAVELYNPEKFFYVVKGNNKSLDKDYDYPVVLKDKYVLYLDSSTTKFGDFNKGETKVIRYNLLTAKKKVILRKKGYSNQRGITKFSDDLVVVKGFDEEPLLLNLQGDNLEFPYQFESLVPLSDTEVLIPELPPSIIKIYFAKKEGRSTFPYKVEKKLIPRLSRLVNSNPDEESSESGININDMYFIFVSRYSVYLVNKTNGNAKELLPLDFPYEGLAANPHLAYDSVRDKLYLTGILNDNIVIISQPMGKSKLEIHPFKDNSIKTEIVVIDSLEYEKEVKTAVNLMKIDRDLRGLVAEFLNVKI